jgi:hypothetical protein
MAATIDTPWTGEQFSPPTPLDLETIESAIVAQLASQITAIEIVHFPDEPKAYRLTHPVGAALVTYRGATYGELLDTAAIVQERRLEFDVTLLVRDLGWGVGSAPDGTSPGAYALLEKTRAALTGYRVPGARKMRPVREKFIERDRRGGVWIYTITFGLSTVAVEPSSAQNFPLFVKGVALDRSGNTTVTVGATAYTFDAQGQIALPNGNVLSLTVSAVGGGQQYAEGVDYTLDAVNGIITWLSTGSIASGATVDVAYSYSESAIAQSGQSAPTGS